MSFSNSTKLEITGNSHLGRLGNSEALCWNFQCPADPSQLKQPCALPTLTTLCCPQRCVCVEFDSSICDIAENVPVGSTPACSTAENVSTRCLFCSDARNANPRVRDVQRLRHERGNFGRDGGSSSCSQLSRARRERVDPGRERMTQSHSRRPAFLWAPRTNLGLRRCTHSSRITVRALPPYAGQN